MLVGISPIHLSSLETVCKQVPLLGGCWIILCRELQPPCSSGTYVGTIHPSSCPHIAECIYQGGALRSITMCPKPFGFGWTDVGLMQIVSKKRVSLSKEPKVRPFSANHWDHMQASAPSRRLLDNSVQRTPATLLPWCLCWHHPSIISPMPFLASCVEPPALSTHIDTFGQICVYINPLTTKVGCTEVYDNASRTIWFWLHWHRVHSPELLNFSLSILALRLMGRYESILTLII